MNKKFFKQIIFVLSIIVVLFFTFLLVHIHIITVENLKYENEKLNVKLQFIEKDNLRLMAEAEYNKEICYLERLLLDSFFGNNSWRYNNEDS